MAIRHGERIDRVLVQPFHGDVATVLELVSRHGQKGSEHELLAFRTTRLPTDSHRTFDCGWIDHLQGLPEIVLHRSHPNGTHHFRECTIRSGHTARHERRLRCDRKRLVVLEHLQQPFPVTVNASQSITMHFRGKGAASLAGSVQGEGFTPHDFEVIEIEEDHPHTQSVRTRVNAYDASDARRPVRQCEHWT